MKFLNPFICLVYFQCRRNPLRRKTLFFLYYIYATLIDFQISGKSENTSKCFTFVNETRIERTNRKKLQGEDSRHIYADICYTKIKAYIYAKKVKVSQFNEKCNRQKTVYMQVNTESFNSHVKQSWVWVCFVYIHTENAILFDVAIETTVKAYHNGSNSKRVRRK